MSEFVSRAQLLQTFEDLNKSFDRSLAGAKDRELQFESLRLGFIGNMSKHLQNAKVDLSDNHPLRPSLLAFIDSMDETRRSWNERIAGRDKGVKFREKFEDSLLVFVNGKVKSGKSSLGNYMAWGNTDPSDAMKRDVTAASAPVYFSEEKTNVKGGDFFTRPLQCQSTKMDAGVSPGFFKCQVMVFINRYETGVNGQQFPSWQV